MTNPFRIPGTMHPRNVAVPRPGEPVHATPEMLALSRHLAPGQLPAGPQLQAMAVMAGPDAVMPGQAVHGRVPGPKHQTAGAALRGLGSLFA